MTERIRGRQGLTPWDRREPRHALTIEENARRAGHYAWVESRLFEVLGAWVEGVPELDVRLRLAAHSYRHAWHAQLWENTLRDTGDGGSADQRVAPPNDAFGAFIDALREPGAPEATVQRLVGVYRVLLPHLVGAYTYHLNNTSTITDAPTARVLRLVLADELEDWRDGEMLLQSLIETEDEARRAGATHGRLEAMMVRAGGVCGPGSIGEAYLPLDG